MPDAQNIPQKITEFYLRLAQNLQKLKKQKHAPTKLKDLIQLPDFLNIFDTLLNNENIKNHVIKNLKMGMPVRLSKELGYFTRTINIVFDHEDNDIFLMLETKTKNATGKKNHEIPVLSGTLKTVKPAWRIDSPFPVKYANAVSYGNKKNNNIPLARTEALTPLQIAKKHDEFESCLHTVMVGAEFKKMGTRDRGHKESYKTKMSFYSKWADQGDLCSFLKGKEGETLTFEERDLLALQLLFAVKLMHNENIVHQDIKLRNILIFKRGESFYLELCDFGLSYNLSLNIRRIAQSSLKYESPEISAIHYYFRKNRGFDYDYFHDASIESHGRNAFLQNQAYFKPLIQAQSERFVQPNKANDMWAVGMVIREIYKAILTTEEGKQKYANFIIKLLHPDRDKRLTAQEAFDQHCHAIMASTPHRNISYFRASLAQKREAPLSAAPLELYTPTFQNKKPNTSEVCPIQYAPGIQPWKEVEQLFKF
jgi:hypothetical protein